MKILVFSDSHGSTDLMVTAVRIEQPDRILHLGDMMRDAQVLAQAYPQVPLDYVPGNCDINPAGHAWEKQLLVEGRTLFLAHGHTLGVKAGIGRAVVTAHTAGADILLFGHTHEPLCDLQNGMWILNPGAMRGLITSTYGVILMDGAKTVCYTATIS